MRCVIVRGGAVVVPEGGISADAIEAATKNYVAIAEILHLPISTASIVRTSLRRAGPGSSNPSERRGFRPHGGTLASCGKDARAPGTRPISNLLLQMEDMIMGGTPRFIEIAAEDES